MTTPSENHKNERRSEIPEHELEFYRSDLAEQICIRNHYRVNLRESERFYLKTLVATSGILIGLIFSYLVKLEPPVEKKALMLLPIAILVYFISGALVCYTFRIAAKIHSQRVFEANQRITNQMLFIRELQDQGWSKIDLPPVGKPESGAHGKIGLFQTTGALFFVLGTLLLLTFAVLNVVDLFGR